VAHLLSQLTCGASASFNFTSPTTSSSPHSFIHHCLTSYIVVVGPTAQCSPSTRIDDLLQVRPDGPLRQQGLSTHLRESQCDHVRIPLTLAHHPLMQCPNKRVNTRQAGTRPAGGGAPHPYSVDYLAME
jgi:hypothetical protein